MNKYPFILLIVICCQSITWAQPKELLVHYYFATDDYLQNNLSVDEILLEVKSMGEDFILVKGIYDPATHKRPDLGWKVWAIAVSYTHLDVYKRQDFFSVQFQYIFSGSATRLLIFI